MQASAASSVGQVESGLGLRAPKQCMVAPEATRGAFTIRALLYKQYLLSPAR